MTAGNQSLHCFQAFEGLFSDEKSFSILQRTLVIDLTACRSIMVWGAKRTEEKIELIFLNDSVNAACYQNEALEHGLALSSTTYSPNNLNAGLSHVSPHIQRETGLRPTTYMFWTLAGKVSLREPN